MATRKKKKIEASLLKKGFVKADGDHHFYVYMTVDGRKTEVFTKTSHTPKQKDIGDDLLAKMAMQCKLTKEEFFRLVDCPLSREGYESILKAKNLC